MIIIMIYIYIVIEPNHYECTRNVVNVIPNQRRSHVQIVHLPIYVIHVVIISIQSPAIIIDISSISVLSVILFINSRVH